ncbi:MAG TPA: hypothetical protein VHW60_13805 [Caulobacteraceae bacterium]|nr:hypothetical protein [Caulobacteraceae bacterium]
MLRRALIASLPLLFVAGAAAAEGPAAAGQYVDLAPVALPVMAGRKLVNYVFVYLRINLTPGADLAKWRDREPYFRDALVKLAHRTPFGLATDYSKLDEPRLKAALFQAATEITGPGQVASIEIMPGGGPMKRTGLPPATH